MSNNLAVANAKAFGEVNSERVACFARNLIAQVPEPRDSRSASVSSGAALYALFLSEMAEISDQPSLKVKAIEQLRWGAELLDTEVLTSSLYQSAPGYAWVLNLIAAEHGLPWAEELLIDLDDLFFDSFRNAGGTLNIDLINGVCGLLVYVVVNYPPECVK
jgi:hypothetical protein